MLIQVTGAMNVNYINTGHIVYARFSFGEGGKLSGQIKLSDGSSMVIDEPEYTPGVIKNLEAELREVCFKEKFSE